jgi:hypothetical protein
VSETVDEHIFNMRLACTYADPDNSVAGLEVEVLGKDGWEQLALGTGTAGFLIFVYAVFNCQHMYMRLNCAERGLLLESASGSIVVRANADWIVQQLHIGFTGKLKSGTPTRDDLDYIVDRMKHCPVSTNMRDVPDSQTTLALS